MSLVAANSRLSVFGLGASVIGGGLMAGFLRLTRWYPAGLCAAATVFLVAGGFALRLPAFIDAPVAADPAALEPDGGRARERGLLSSRPRPQFRGRLATALRGESALRSAAGFLTIFLAFHIEQTSHGFAASAAFAAVLAGSGLGQLIGTVTGARIRTTRPQRLIMGGLGVCGATFVLPAAVFSLPTAVGCIAVTSLTNSLGKVSLDSIIQRDMPRPVTSRAFARSETVLQLAWVLGAVVGLLLPTTRPHLAVGVAAAALLTSAVIVTLRARSPGAGVP
jgi:hypothetical protein